MKKLFIAALIIIVGAALFSCQNVMNSNDNAQTGIIGASRVTFDIRYKYDTAGSNPTSQSEAATVMNSVRSALASQFPEATWTLTYGAWTGGNMSLANLLNDLMADFPNLLGSVSMIGFSKNAGASETGLQSSDDHCVVHIDVAGYNIVRLALHEIGHCITGNGANCSTSSCPIYTGGGTSNTYCSYHHGLVHSHLGF